MMVLGEILEAIGLGGGLVLLVSVLVGIYHIREGIQAVSGLQTWIMATSLFVVFLVAAAIGLVPGMDPQLGRLLSWFIGGLSGIVNAIADLAGGFL